MENNSTEYIESGEIEVMGARMHNLKNIDVNIPRNQLVTITGLSGSGKSSLAFDTIFAEGQRRYLESFSAYARQFIGDLERPDVDSIKGLSPVIAIEQKTVSKNPRSTVGTITEIYDFLRLLYARAGEAYSYINGNKMIRLNEDQIISQITSIYLNQKIYLLAPVVKGRKGHYRELFEQIRKQGYTKVRIDGEIKELLEKMQVDRYKIHDIEILIDRIQPGEDPELRLKESIRTAMKTGKGVMMIADVKTNKSRFFSKFLMDPESGLSYDEPQPNSFSFNSPYGACPVCDGLGQVNEVLPENIMPDPKLSIIGGGLSPLGEYKDNYTFQQIKALAKKYKFSLSESVGKLKPETIEIILNGSDEPVTFEYEYASGYKQQYSVNWEGLIPLITRHYFEKGNESISAWAEEFMVQNTCSVCNGGRLKVESLHYKIDEKNIAQLAEMDIGTLSEWFTNLESRFSERQLIIGAEILKEIRSRIGFLMGVGLDYLTLNSPSKTLSGGEAQRIRLASQIGSQLQGVLYILDEPSIGLHQRDNNKLIQSLKDLRDVGNSVIVVEHDKDMIMESDYIFDIGPGAGVHGGHVIAEGTVKNFMTQNSVTAQYISGAKKIEVPKQRRKGNGNEISLKGCEGNNLKNVNVKFPLGTLIAVTGVSGSGKSSLINETLYPIMHHHFFRTNKKSLPYKKIEGLEHIDKVIEIDQS
ncbi:MAG: excinuclease ABC subunit UvrA, partial [Bacteroidetes bacterium]|nr:excinuclease ABC subunit UvrA [Bacteroidota bacterium]